MRTIDWVCKHEGHALKLDDLLSTMPHMEFNGMGLGGLELDAPSLDMTGVESGGLDKSTAFALALDATKGRALGGAHGMASVKKVHLGGAPPSALPGATMHPNTNHGNPQCRDDVTKVVFNALRNGCLSPQQRIELYTLLGP
jgi:hypothetical protein